MHRRLWVAVTALALSACAGFQQAYDERVCWRNGLPEECPYHSITLNCSASRLATSVPEDASASAAYLRISSVPSNVLVGYLFSQYGDKPIYLENRPASSVLQRDLGAILESGGLSLQASAHGADFIFQGEFTLLDVHSEPGGFFDIKVPTIARVSFRITATDAGGEQLWTREFNGREEISVAYALLKDSESALNQAYCGALEAFEGYVQELLVSHEQANVSFGARGLGAQR